MQSADDYLRPLPAQPAAVVTGDFDGNGLDDVMVGYGGDYLGITLAHQDAYGAWTRDDLGTFVFGSELMAVTDLDGDGASDLIAAARGLDRFNVLRNSGDGTFTNSVKVVAPSSPDNLTHISALASATAPSGKRLVALAFSTEDPEAAVKPNNVIVYEAAGGTLTATSLFQFFDPAPGQANALQLHDLDADGRLDLLVGTVDGTVQVYRGLASADGVFETAPTTLSHPAHTAPVTALAAGDVGTAGSTGMGDFGNWPADGEADVVAAFADGSAVFGWRGQGGMAFDPPATVGDQGIPDVDRTVALAIDPEGSGRWSGLARGTALAFAQGPGDFYPLLFRNGCNTAAGAVLFNDDPVAPYALALVCPSSSGVLVTIPGRQRLLAPPSLALGSQRVGTAGGDTTATLAAPDVVVDDDGNYVGYVDVAGARIEGPDAEDFELARAHAGPCGAPGSPSAQVACNPQVRFAPRSPGPKQATLVIDSDAYRTAGAPPQSIALSGTGTGAVTSAPSSLALGDVSFGSSATAPLTLTNTGNEPLTIAALELEDAGEGWAVTLGTCSAAVAPGASCDAEVRYEPPAPGAASASLRIRSDAVGAEPAVELSARGIASGVTAAPLALGTIAVGESRAEALELLNSGDDALSISAVAAAGPDAGRVAVDAADCLAGAVAPGEGCALDVTVTPATRGPLDATLEVVSNAPSSPNVVALSATGVQGVLDAPSSVALGTVRVGHFAEREVELENTGDAPLGIGTLAVEGPVELTADGCSGMTLATGARCAVTVRFAPAAAGALEARLVVPNDGEGGERTTTLTGTGLPAEEPGAPSDDASDRGPARGGDGSAGVSTPGGAGPAGMSAPARLKVTAPRRATVRLGGSLRLRVRVTNTGGSAVTDAKLKLRLPATLRRMLQRKTARPPSAGGSRGPAPQSRRPYPPLRTRTVTLPFGSLAQDASRVTTVTLRTRPRTRPGEVRFAVRAVATGIESAAATTTVRIR